MQKQVVKWAVHLILILNLGAAIVIFTPLTEALYQPLIVNEPPGQGELIVVLASGFFPNNQPDFQTMVRLRKGAELYRQGVAAKILCLGGGWHSKGGESLSEAMANELSNYHNIPQKDLLTLSETNHTYDDITSMVARFGGLFNFNRTIFVSSAYHTLRIKYLLLKKGITGPVVAAEPSGLYPRKAYEHISTFRNVIREYMAIIYSWLAGWLEL
jgi:uncharacterized SAM-binding protein YcdF (DUF218 family)